MAMPEQLRRPVAKLRTLFAFRIEHAHHGPVLFLAPGGAEPVRLLEGLDLLWRLFGIPAATLEAEPIETKRRWPSRETARSRVQCRFGGDVRDDDFGRAPRLAVAGVIG